ncbi:Enolase C-terminal domain-like protein [Tylopilus felleus]
MNKSSSVLPRPSTLAVRASRNRRRVRRMGRIHPRGSHRSDRRRLWRHRLPLRPGTQTASRTSGARFYRGGPVLMSALSALDIALWDIKGKKLGVPIWQLLSGKVCDRFRVYGWVGGDHPTVVREAAAERKQQGFTAVKMNASRLSFANVDIELILVTCRRSSLDRFARRPHVDRRARERGMARQLAVPLEKEGVLFIEGKFQTIGLRVLSQDCGTTDTEPLLPTFPSESAVLARSVSVPIAAGERLYSRHDFRPFFEGKALDIAQPDMRVHPVRRSGAAELRDELAGEARHGHTHYKEANLYTYLEDPTVFAVRDGYIQAPSGPGLGITINEKFVRERSAPYTESAWRNPQWRESERVAETVHAFLLRRRRI